MQLLAKFNYGHCFSHNFFSGYDPGYYETSCQWCSNTKCGQPRTALFRFDLAHLYYNEI